MDSFEIIVIGGVAAGMMAAIIAGKKGKKTILIEKNPVLGKKLLISGKGRCNITNYCDVKELIENIPTNGKFLINSFYHFSAYDAIDFFHKIGLRTKVERGNRVFPISDKASEVVRILEKTLQKSGVMVVKEARVLEITKDNKFQIQTSAGKFAGKKIVLCTGGKSYPGTGSTGDGYTFAKKFGHKIISPKAALVPIEAQFFLRPWANS